MAIKQDKVCVGVLRVNRGLWICFILVAFFEWFNR